MIVQQRYEKNYLLTKKNPESFLNRDFFMWDYESVLIAIILILRV